MERIGLVVNENAGNSLGKKDLHRIEAELQKHGLEYTVLKTDYQGHAMNLAEDLIRQGFRRIVGVGGDGTLNEVLNGAMRQDHVSVSELVIGNIPVGSGNDWGRTMLVPNDYPEAVRLIAEGKIVKQDVGLVTSLNHPENKRYFINVAGGGFDAFVARKTNQLKQNGKGSAFTYLLALFTSMFKFKSSKVKLMIDDTPFEDTLLSFSIGIGQYNGGGMKQLPNAIYNDGLLDITTIRHITHFKMVRSVPKLYDGSHLALKEVKTFTARRVVVQSSPNVLIETDGENCGETPVEVTIFPLAIQVFSGLA
ncbi:MAG: diacylglycerol kinase family lipid kinase [Bacteroidales bacterium]|nr:diacylglycerol kinase family lipid kinase [Bacteroidales bacterium]